MDRLSRGSLLKNAENNESLPKLSNRMSSRAQLNVRRRAITWTTEKQTIILMLPPLGVTFHFVEQKVYNTTEVTNTKVGAEIATPPSHSCFRQCNAGRLSRIIVAQKMRELHLATSNLIVPKPRTCLGSINFHNYELRHKCLSPAPQIASCRWQFPQYPTFTSVVPLQAHSKSRGTPNCSCFWESHNKQPCAENSNLWWKNNLRQCWRSWCRSGIMAGPHRSRSRLRTAIVLHLVNSLVVATPNRFCTLFCRTAKMHGSTATRRCPGI